MPKDVVLFSLGFFLLLFLLTLTFELVAAKNV